MTSGRAQRPIPAQSSPSPASVGEPATFRRTYTYRFGSPAPITWVLARRPESSRGLLAWKAPGPAMVRRRLCRPRVLLDRELYIVRANQSMCRAFGVLQQNLAGTRADDWVNIDPSVLDRLRTRIGNESVAWHVILRLRLSGLRVAAVSPILRPLRSWRSGYLLISLAGLQ